MTDDMQREAFERKFGDLNTRRMNPHSDVYEDPKVDLRWEGWKTAIRHMREQELSCAHEWQEGYGVKTYCHHCGVEKQEFKA